MAELASRMADVLREPLDSNETDGGEDPSTYQDVMRQSE
jgi:hypothetical protein